MNEVRVITSADHEWTSRLTTGLGEGGMEVKRLLTMANGGPEEFAVVLARTPPGGHHDWHQRPEAECVVVLEGEATFSYERGDGETETVVLKQGDCVYVPADVPHQNRNEGTDPQLILGIHCPAHL